MLTAAEAQQGLASVTFRDEQRWSQNLDFPSITTTEVTAWAASGCWTEDQEVPEPSGALGMRSVTAPNAHIGQVRQLAVFPDAAAAAAAFADLRATIRGCQAANTGLVQDGLSTEFVGGQLQLGDESFWTSDRQFAEQNEDEPVLQHWSMAHVLVLDGNVITVLAGPAGNDSVRAKTVADLSAEWEQLRHQYAPMLR